MSQGSFRLSRAGLDRAHSASMLEREPGTGSKSAMKQQVGLVPFQILEHSGPLALDIRE